MDRSGLWAGLWNHRIITFLELEETFKDHLVQLPCNEQGHPQLGQVAQTLVSLTLEVSRDGEILT